MKFGVRKGGKFMVEAKIPKDIRSYKTKVVGPLTFRQLICGTITVVVDLILWFLIFKDMNMSPRLIISIGALIDLPILAFCFSVNGMPMETYVKVIYTLNFKYPMKRRAEKCLREEYKPALSEKERRKRAKELEAKYKINPEFKPYK